VALCGDARPRFVFLFTTSFTSFSLFCAICLPPEGHSRKREHGAPHAEMAEMWNEKHSEETAHKK